MNQYRIEYSYTTSDGQRENETDTSTAWTAQEAVDDVRRWYGDLDDLRIEYVWVDRDNRWEITEAWG